MRTLLRTLFVSLLSLAAAASAAAGQRSDAGSDPTGTQSSSSSIGHGWSITPALLLARTYDDNVLLRGPGDPTENDFVNVINPRGELAFNSPKSQFAAR